MVPPPSTPQVLIQASVPETSEPKVIFPPTPDQVPLPPSVGTSHGSVAALSGCSGHSTCDSHRHKSRDKLTHLPSIASLAYRPLLVDAVVIHLSTISWMHAANRAKLESFLLPEGLVPSPDNIKDLLSLARYTNLYANSCGDYITNSMLSEISVDT